MVLLKKVFLIFGMIVGFVHAANVTIPKNFKRSRYSHRKTTTTIAPIPILGSLETNETDVGFDTNNNISSSTTLSLPTTTTEPILSSSTDVDPSLLLLSNSTESNSDDSVTTPSESVSTTVEPNTDSITVNATNETESETELFCGEKTDDDHPWIVVIEHTDPTGRSRKKSLSKGVLIDERHVLTTLSSIFNAKPFWVVSSVRMGDTPTWGTYSDDRNRSAVQYRAVQEVYQHKSKDIAIIRLVESVNITNKISPICLPVDDNYNFRELELHVCQRAGWDALTESHQERTVALVPVAPLMPQDCTIMFNRKHAALATEQFCAWDEVGDTCTGDLGGPLMGKVNGRYQVIGLKSYVNLRNSFPSEDYPGVYTRVGSHLQWINTILNAE